MNYIPGFSNYLQTVVPRYALGGRVNQGEPLIDDMEFSDYGLGGPMMGEETVGFDLANPMLGGPEQGGSYTGGMGGGDSRTAAERLQAILDVNPYVAPTEGMNLDPITSRGQTGYYFANELGLPARYGDVGSPKPADPATYDPNAKYIEPMPGFVPVDPNATYRLVNGGTDGSVVYSGAGEEGLRNVFQQANKLTLDNPKNAYWGVEVFNPATGKYDRVAENQGPNGLGIVGKIAGVALPIAAAIATGGASLGVQIAAGAAAGGLGGFLSGKDILKSALIGGATAGIGNVSGFNEAVGGALSNAGDAVKNALIPQVATQAAGGLTDDIVVNALSGLAKGVGGGALQGAASAVTSAGSPTPAQPTPTQQPAEYDPINYGDVEPIVVTGGGSTTGLGGLSGLGGGVTASLPALGGLASDPFLSQPTPTEQPYTQEPEVTYPEEEIVVTAPKAVTPDLPFSAVLPTLPDLIPPLSDPALMQPEVTYPEEEIVVSGERAPPVSGSGSPLGAAFSIPVNEMLSGALNAAQPTQQTKTAEDIEAEKNPMVVTGGGLESLTPDEILLALGGTGALTAATAGGVGTPTQQPTAQEQTAEDIEAAKNPMVVTGGGLESLTPAELLSSLSVAGTAAATAGGVGTPTQQPTAQEQTAEDIEAAKNPITVTGSESLTPAELLSSLSAAGTAAATAGSGATADPAPTDGGNKLGVKDYIDLGVLLAGLIPGASGGGGSGSGGTIPAGMGALSSLFTKELPTSTLPGGGALPASTLASQGLRSPQDYYRYGYGPEQSFFSYVPQGAPNTSRAYTGYEGSTAEDEFAARPTGFARGGFAVEGAGDGRDDKIPALLSDGEYVIDAETVALLGNGSNKAGAKLLDSFRVKVRKQKGKKLARGKFSDNAKRPEQYMAGGPA